MNWFDLTVGILLLIAFINGYRKGLIMQLVGLATIVLAAIFGGRLASTILPEINRLIDLSPEAARVLSFILAFAAIAIALSLVGRILQRFIDIIFLSFINRLLGAVIATGTMMVFLSIILNLVLMLDYNEQVINKKTKEESFFFERVEAVIPAIVPYLQPQLWDEIIPEKYREEIERKSEPIDSTYQQRHFNI
ncbi:CvpA family protein [Proteiniphilum acetatigenes]|uniref:CvpA family protein n=1 Tax=Proteiniphilum acetatigenes TaxID=294710 RepID=UPI000382E80D|nr:CvpA family protein [Proteiniphilum acetatigenes]SFK32989.1 membrane protein required for colicin V production [Porphyromonadaceae bacterium KH3CP3RA]